MIKKFLIAVNCGSFLLAAAPPAPVYTAAQAAAGRAAYESICAQCHTDKLTGRDGTGDIPEIARPFHGKIPPLAGANAAFPPFLTKWGSRTTKDLSARVNVAVGGFTPKDATPEAYLDITAYVLQVNGARPGTQALAADTAAGIAEITSPGALPAAAQNALVEKYCAVCHNDRVPGGGLNLQHFDAANPDPGVAAMMASKLKANAMSASGAALPDRATQDALLNALSGEAAGSRTWTLRRSENPPTVAVSVVEEAPSTSGGEPDLYHLTVTCRVDTRRAEMQLAWSPGVPENGRLMSAAGDDDAQASYKIEGSERMAIGGNSGPGAILLTATGRLPEEKLTIRNLFGKETVVFPFGSLGAAARQDLAACFSGSVAAQ